MPMTKKEIFNLAIEAAAVVAESRASDVDEIFKGARGKTKLQWIAMIRRESKECAAKIRKLKQ